VSGASELLGFAPCYSANEGRAIFVVSLEVAEKTLKTRRNSSFDAGSEIVGEIMVAFSGKPRSKPEWDPCEHWGFLPPNPCLEFAEVFFGLGVDT